MKHLGKSLLLRQLRAYWTSFKIDRHVINPTSLIMTLVDSYEDLQNPQNRVFQNSFFVQNWFMSL